MAKKARAEAKRQKRLGRGELFELEHGRDLDEAGDAVEPAPSGGLSNDEIMEMVADLSRRYDDGQLDLETYVDERANLMAQISVD